MRVIRDLAAVPDDARGAVVAIGNFDGVHPGHRLVIDECRRVARHLGRPAAVMAFDPHPRAFFRPDEPPFRLTPAEHRARLLGEAGIDLHFLVPFDTAFAGLSAEAFVETVLCRTLGVAHVVVGFDFHYGKGRRGGTDSLRAAGRALGFGVVVVAEASDEAGGVYSSTRVREALAAGDMDLAAQSLGRPFEIEGVVAQGDRRGRLLGYPTANVDPGDYARPRYGVYAVQVAILAAGAAPDGAAAPLAWQDGVANFGVRPMYALDRPLIEAHLFGFDGDLYGRRVRVRFAGFLRGEQRFDQVGDLVAQMDRDSQAARDLLGTTARPDALRPVAADIPVVGDESGDQTPRGGQR